MENKNPKNFILGLRLLSDQSDISKSTEKRILNKILKKESMNQKKLLRKRNLLLMGAFALVIFTIVPIYLSSFIVRNQRELTPQEKVGAFIRKSYLAQAGDGQNESKYRHPYQLKAGQLNIIDTIRIKNGKAFCGNEFIDYYIKNDGSKVSYVKKEGTSGKEYSYTGTDGFAYLGATYENNQLKNFNYSNNDSVYEYMGGKFVGKTNYQTNPEEIKERYEYSLVEENEIINAEEEIKDLKIESLNSGYKSTYTSEFPCHKESDKVIQVYTFNADGNLTGDIKYLNEVKESNLISKDSIKINRIDSHYQDVVNKLIDIKSILPKNIGLKEIQFTQSNFSENKSFKNLFRKNNITLLLSESNEYKIYNIIPSATFEEPEAPNEFYLDPNFFSSKEEFDNFWKKQDDGMNIIEGEAIVSLAVKKSDEDYNYNGFMMDIYPKAKSDYEILANGIWTLFDLSEQELIKKDPNELKQLESINLQVDNEQKEFRVYSINDHVVALVTEFGQNKMVIDGFAEKTKLEDIQKVNFVIKDSSKEIDLNYLEELVNKIYPN